VNSLTDPQLLRDYTERRSEAAFAELVRRHVDFVHSAALRMVCDAHLAKDVTQGVFIALAQNGRQLADRPVLSGWLHRTAQNLAANAVRSDVRRRAREQEAAAMNELLSAESDANWENIAPHLDAGLGELDEADRDALLLRYFERKSAREMAEILGTSEDAAQKRVSRAVERLREFFSKRNVTIGAGGLVVLISANAVQSAPIGLAATISAAAVLAGTAVSTSTAVAATKAIAMTTLQKTFITATVAVLAGAGIYEVRQASQLGVQVQTLQQQQAPLMTQIAQLQSERDKATNQAAGLLAEIEQLKSHSNENELLKLRGEVTGLRAAQSRAANEDAKDAFTQFVLALASRAAQLNQHLQQMPEKKIPELQLLDASDWLAVAKDAKFDTDADIRKALQKLRSIAKDKVPIGSALHAFANANNGQLPTDLSQLKPYFNQSHLGDLALDDSTFNAIIGRYMLLHTGNVNDFPSGTWFVAEKAPVDKDYDSREKFGLGTSESFATGIGEAGDPDAPSY
jgi:RNA polymerase sigma factor (sigma-70 family)